MKTPAGRAVIVPVSNEKKQSSSIQMIAEQRLQLPPRRFFHTGENRLFLLGLASAGLLLVLIALPLFRGTVYEFDDLNNYHLPFRYFYAQCLKAGDNFTWVPSVYCGYYLHGEGQVGMFHPLHLLLYRFLPLDIAYNLELFLSYPFMLAGMFFFLRRWNLPRDASMLGALVFAFSGFTVLHYVHMNVVAVASHIPWMLLAIDMVVRSPSTRKRSVFAFGLALLTGSQLLLGNPQAFWYSSLTEVLYALLLIRPWNDIPAYVRLGTAKALGAAIGAIQVLAHREGVAASFRDIPSLDFLMWPSVRPVHLLQIAAPYFFNESVFEYIGYGLKAYNGAVPLVLVVFLLLRLPQVGPLKKLAAGVLFLNLVSILMAMGKYGYVYRLQTFLPIVGLFREPNRYILLFHLTMSIGAAIAFATVSALVRDGGRTPWRALSPLLLVPLVSILPYLLALIGRTVDSPSLLQYFVLGMSAKINMLIAGPLIMISATALVLLAARGKDIAIFGLILLAAVDLLFYGVNSTIGSDGIRPIDNILKSFPTPGANPGQYRVQSDDVILIMKGLNLADGYAGLPPKRELQPLDKSRLRLAGAQWIMSKTPKYSGGRSFGMTLPKPLPRVRLVTKAVVSENIQQDIDKIDIASTALVDHDIGLQEGSPGSATIISDRPGRISIAAQSNNKQLLVLSESYHRGWQAKVDGKRLPVLRVYGDFMGCIVDDGNHVVDFVFRPKSLIIGAWVSLTGITAALLLFLISLRGTRPSK